MFSGCLSVAFQRLITARVRHVFPAEHVHQRPPATSVRALLEGRELSARQVMILGRLLKVISQYVDSSTVADILLAESVQRNLDNSKIAQMTVGE